MMDERFWKRAREFLRGPDREHARRAEADSFERTERGLLPRGLLRDQESLRNDPSRALRLGRFSEGPLAGEDLFADARGLLAHSYALGVSGSGKSFLMLRLLADVLGRGLAKSAVVLDPKGEIAELLTDKVLPALAASLPAAEADAFLGRIVVIDPFSTARLPPLNVLVRDPGVPVAVQARDVAECFEAAAETDVTARMETVLDWTLRLVIETGGSFLTVRRALQEPAVLEGLVRMAKDKDTVRYFLTRFASEPNASKLALLARLDRFLAMPMAQLSLGAKGCLDFDRLLEDRITVVALGNAPAGLRSVARFFAMVVMTRFVRAVFRRPQRAQGFASVILADEWQMTLNSALASEFESILTLARSRGVYLWLANQQLAQLDRYGAGLRSIALGETANQFLLRLAAEDASALRGAFPTLGMRRRPGHGNASPVLSPAEERDARIASASRSPDRTGYWLDRRGDWGAIPFRTATLALPAPSSLPRGYVERARRGAVAFTVAELERMRDEEDARLDRLAAGPVRARPPAPPTPAAPPPCVPVAAPAVAATAAPAKAPPRRRGPRHGGGLPSIR